MPIQIEDYDNVEVDDSDSTFVLDTSYVAGRTMNLRSRSMVENEIHGTISYPAVRNHKSMFCGSSNYSIPDATFERLVKSLLGRSDIKFKKEAVQLLREVAESYMIQLFI